MGGSEPDYIFSVGFFLCVPEQSLRLNQHEVISAPANIGCSLLPPVDLIGPGAEVLLILGKTKIEKFWGCVMGSIQSIIRNGFNHATGQEF